MRIDHVAHALEFAVGSGALLGGVLGGRHIALKVVVEEDETSVAVLYQCRSAQQANEVASACLAAHGHLGVSVITICVDTKALVTVRQHLGQ